MAVFRRVLAWKADALVIVLVLADVLFLTLAAFGAIVSALGMAATITNASSANTVEKGFATAALSAWWLPYVYAIVAVALTVFLCVRFIQLTKTAQPAATVPLRNEPPEGFIAGALSNQVATLRVELSPDSPDEFAKTMRPRRILL